MDRQRCQKESLNDYLNSCVFLIQIPADSKTSSIQRFKRLLQMPSGSIAPDCASIKWADQFHELASAAFHVDFGPSPKMAGWLEGAGFEDVEVQTEIVPVGPWPKDRRLKEI